MTSKDLLLDLFDVSNSDLKAGSPADDFRIEHADDMQTIEKLETAGFILREEGNYRLHIKSILCIVNRSADAKRVRTGVIDLIDELRQQYSTKRAEHAVSILDIARNLAGSEDQYQLYADYLQQIVPVRGNVYGAEPTIHACESLYLDVFGKPVADGKELLDRWWKFVLRELPLPDGETTDSVIDPPLARSIAQHIRWSGVRAAHFRVVLHCIRFKRGECVSHSKLVPPAMLAEISSLSPLAPMFDGEEPLSVTKLAQYLQNAIKGSSLPSEAKYWTPEELVRRTLLQVVAANPTRLSDENSVPTLAKEVHEKLDWPIGFQGAWNQSQIHADLQNILQSRSPETASNAKKKPST